MEDGPIELDKGVMNDLSYGAIAKGVYCSIYCSNTKPISQTLPLKDTK